MLLLLLSMLVGLTLAQNPNYNYQRPHVAFNVESQAKLPAKFVVQTLGPNSRTYDVESHRAPTVYENHQTQVVAQQQQISYQQSAPQQPQIIYSQPQQQQVQQQFVHQQQVQHQIQQHVQQQVQQQQQYAYQQQLQAPPQQLHTTSYANPLLINAATYQQQTPTLVSPPAPAPPAQPISYYAQPQQLVSYQAPPAPPPPAPVYGVAVQQQQLPQRLYFKNPQPYAVVTLPNGQKTLDAGHGSGFAPNEVQYKLLASTGSQSTAPRVGDHVGQSQSSSLDAFKYKQAVPDDTREYQRFVNNCAANGQCQQFNLSPGQIDPSHQQLLQQARASTQPRIEGCTKSEAIYVPVGAQLNNQGQLRPKGRRQFERKEQQFDRHPYN